MAFDYIDTEVRNKLTTAINDEGIIGIQCNEINEQGLRCQRCYGHQKTHKFLKPGMISRSYFIKMLHQLTDGQIKNLAGLDNTDTLKGYENFIQMEEIANKLCDLGSISTDKRKELSTKINWSKAYHKSDFTDHLGTDSNHICACIQCGFHDPKVDDIPCQKRDLKCHLGPCEDCLRSFDCITGLYNLHKAVLTSHNWDPLTRDKMANFQSDIGKCKNYLEEYRAHLVQKSWESKEEQQFYKGLKKGHAAVICDFKMKILAFWFRENMEKFFGKSGFTCLGFMIVFGSDNPEEKDVQYHFCLSDDTGQDVASVLAFKAYVYKEILPQEGIRFTHWRSDGAKCFSQKLMKLCTALWSRWTNGQVIELSCKISVAGCGKTLLDALFGVLTHVIMCMIRSGHSFESALALIELFIERPVQASTFSLIAPNRCIKHFISKMKAEELKASDLQVINLAALQSIYHLKLTDDGKGMIGYRHSNLGTGVYFDIKTIERLVSAEVPDPMVEEEDCELGGEEQVDKKRNASRDVLPPPPPSYHLLKSTYTGPHSSSDKSKLISKPFRERKKEHNERLHDARNRKLLDRAKNHRRKLKDSGIFVCPHYDALKQFCICQFTNETRFQKHIRKGNHKFASIDSNTRDLRAFTDSSKMGFQNSVGSHKNLDHLVQPRATKPDAPALPVFSHESFDLNFEHGFYNSRITDRKRYTKTMLADLEELYQRGIRDKKDKVSPELAKSILDSMQVKIDGFDRMKYTNGEGNKNGFRLNISQIKAWFSIRSNKDDKILPKGNTALEMKELLANERLPTTPRLMLLKLLCLHNNTSSNNYEHHTVKQLEDICHTEKLLDSRNKTTVSSKDLMKALLQKCKII